MPIGIPIVKQAANDYLSPNFAHTFQNTDFLKTIARISVLNGLAVPRVFRQPGKSDNDQTPSSLRSGITKLKS